ELLRAIGEQDQALTGRPVKSPCCTRLHCTRSCGLAITKGRGGIDPGLISPSGTKQPLHGDIRRLALLRSLSGLGCCRPCLLLALSGHSTLSYECPLSGVKADMTRSGGRLESDETRGDATSHMPIALWAASICFMHPALSPFFIAAFDMSRAVVASFCLVASVIFAIMSSICFI